MWIKKSCASLFLFCLHALFCFDALLQGPYSVHLVIGNCFSWKTGVLIRPGESCMLSRGHSAKETYFQEEGEEEN